MRNPNSLLNFNAMKILLCEVLLSLVLVIMLRVQVRHGLICALLGLLLLVLP